ncbi:MAG: hypothetical protein ACRCUY_02730, partial [Thermoguttaceae bacterium]
MQLAKSFLLFALLTFSGSFCVANTTSWSESEYIVSPFDECESLESSQVSEIILAQTCSPHESGASTLLGQWQKGALTVVPYGFLNINCIYETSPTFFGDYALFVQQPSYGSYLGNSASRFFIDAKTTRLGVKVDGPGLGSGSYFNKATGVVECDFQSSSGFTMRNRGGVQLRRALISLEGRNTKLLLGQDWEVISPLNPFMVNYVPAIGAGNIGYRRAQARIDQTFKCSGDSQYLLQVALCDSNPRGMFDTANVPNGASGSWPMLQARLAYRFGEKTFRHRKPITIGVSSHVGEERFSFAALTRQNGAVVLREKMVDKGILTWSINGDFEIPLTNRTKFMSEVFMGDNLSSVEGGILQGVDYYSAKGIRSC